MPAPSRKKHSILLPVLGVMFIAMILAGGLLGGLWVVGSRFRGAGATPPNTDLTFPAFITQWPKDGARVYVGCTLDDRRSFVGAYEKCKETHLSLYVSQNGQSERAYVPKDSPAGKRIYEICKDGRWHPLTLRLKHAGPDGKPTEPGWDKDGIAVLEIISE
jgi:hypothetical protein